MSFIVAFKLLLGSNFKNICAGNARNIVVAERVVLNFMQRMSGIATLTKVFLFPSFLVDETSISAIVQVHATVGMLLKRWRLVYFNVEMFGIVKEWFVSFEFISEILGKPLQPSAISPFMKGEVWGSPYGRRGFWSGGGLPHCVF